MHNHFGRAKKAFTFNKHQNSWNSTTMSYIMVRAYKTSCTCFPNTQLHTSKGEDENIVMKDEKSFVTEVSFKNSRFLGIFKMRKQRNQMLQVIAKQHKLKKCKNFQKFLNKLKHEAKHSMAKCRWTKLKLCWKNLRLVVAWMKPHSTDTRKDWHWLKKTKTK